MDKKYIGVFKDKKKWAARICHNGQRIYIGAFNTPEEAALAYDEKAYELKGDNWKFNFKNNHHLCEGPNCNNDAVTKFQNFWVCAKHKSQLIQNGKFLSRTIYDPNEIILDRDYAFILLYNKECNEIARTKIDTKNLEKVQNYKWYLRPDGYVATNNYNGEYAYLHCVIFGKKNKNYIDHKDRNKLNNTEDNLRDATGSENQMNKGIRTNNTSGKVGVHWAEEQNAWCASICVKGKRINLGYFLTFEEAVACRENAEKQYFKEYRTNNEKTIENLKEYIRGEI